MNKLSLEIGMFLTVMGLCFNLLGLIFLIGAFPNPFEFYIGLSPSHMLPFIIVPIFLGSLMIIIGLKGTNRISQKKLR